MPSHTATSTRYSKADLVEGHCRGSCNGLMYEERLRLSVVLQVITTGRCMPHQVVHLHTSCLQVTNVQVMYKLPCTCCTCQSIGHIHLYHCMEHAVPRKSMCFPACLSTEVQADCEVWPAMHAQTDTRLSSGRHTGTSEQEGVACGASSAEVVDTV